jgi:uncharacterized repeat protein (TIGR01451 family)
MIQVQGTVSKLRTKLIIAILGALVLFLTVETAQAVNCSDAPYNGVIDGNFTSAPDQIQIDTNCTIRNFPSPNVLSTNFSFYTQPGVNQDRWLVVFDNVVHTGNMSCNNVAGHRIWFTNGSSTTIQEGCQNLLIPVEKIDKQNPADQAAAAIGVPFTYKLTIPVLYDPAMGVVINSSGSLNQLHGVTIWDDLNATGADLSYVSHVAYWQGQGSAVPHSFFNAGGVLTFDFPSDFVIQANDQMVIEITVVLDDTPRNTAGTQFFNTAKWEFGRLIDGTFYEPLPGEWGRSEPLTIVAPNIVVEKTGTTALGGTTINLGEWGEFTLDVWNNGTHDAWDVSLLDRLPDGPTGGMCDMTPQVTGVMLAGRSLTQDTHYTLNYYGAPTCELSLNLLEEAGPVGPGEHLLVTYQTKLDVDSQIGATLTNVAGAIQWFNDNSSNAGRSRSTRTLTNGTAGTLDHEDSHTESVTLSGYIFEKTVENLTRGMSPASVAVPGDRLRYTLRLQTADAISNFNVYDELDALNMMAAFAPGTLTLVSPLPAGAVNNNNPTGGTKGTGLIDISNLSLPAGSQLLIQFDVTIASTVANGTIIANQSHLLANGELFTVSDDPNINGQSDPLVSGDEDPTRVVALTAILASRKTVENLTTGQSGANASPGNRLRYSIAIENTTDIPLNNFSLVDELERLNAAPMFQPGSIENVKLDGADYVINGSTLTVNNLNIGPNETLTVSFEVVLAPVITNGTVVLNQGQLLFNGIVIGNTDDPDLAGNHDPTETLISSAPVLRVEKTSQDMTGDPAVLFADDTLRYTISVKNIGTENAVDVVVRDQLPASTTYVSNSTTLNGAPVADAGGASPLQGGLLINTPADPTPGSIPADATGSPSHVAIITFDVVINSDAVIGTIISNQGLVNGTGAGGDPIPETPSDDPDPPVPGDDPTRDIIGNLPLLDATKIVSLIDKGSPPHSVDPGDELLYTIVVTNFGNIPATGVMLTDAVPEKTTYVVNSTFLNGVPVSDPSANVSPLRDGMLINADGSDNGIIPAGASVTVTFKVQIDVTNVFSGDVISNQGYVASIELPTDEPTDADGIDSNGDQPTTIVVGSAQQLLITKEVFVVGGGETQAGGQLEYLVRVTNTGTIPATHVVLTDDLASLAGQASIIAGSATLNGSTTGVTYAVPVLTANYSANYGDLPPAATASLRFRVQIDSALPIGSTLTNTAQVSWSTPTLTAESSVSIDLGGIPGSTMLNGHVWHDSNFDNVYDSEEQNLAGWTVALYRNNVQLSSVTTDADGLYRISGLLPSLATADQYELRFSAPGAAATTAKLGMAHSGIPERDGLQQISGIDALPGSNLQNLNLPIDPNGVVFDSIVRSPIAGAMLTMLRAGSTTALPGSCFDDPTQQNQVTLASGFYKFDLNYSDASCPQGGNYVIRVTQPVNDYLAGPSRIIPPVSHEETAAYSVATCSADAVPSPTGYCEAQASAYAPEAEVPAAQINHYLHLTLSNPIPGDSQLFNNHIAIDPMLDNALTIRKTSALVNVSRGQLVPYTIKVTNTKPFTLQDLQIVDTFPPGFRYVEGSARLRVVDQVDSLAVEPDKTSRTLTWSSLQVESGETKAMEIKLLFIVGSGVAEGEYVNRAQLFHTVLDVAVSGVATATVRVVPDPTFDCTDVIGKVFDDRNLNGQQEQGEDGLAGVRVVTARGLISTTDEHGRFHLTCAVVPDEDRGSNFILKLDDRSLPTGYRVTTENPRVQRATRGKMLRFNFGATIHRVVAIDIADGVFEPDTTELRLQWTPKIDQLLAELKKSPSVLRLSYLADVERDELVKERLKMLKKKIASKWKRLDGKYRLTIETEIFWRRGGPPER